MKNLSFHFQTFNFPIHLSAANKGIGCGITAISMLTGENPIKLARKYQKNTKDFPDDLMVSHLRAKGFELLKIEANAIGQFNDEHVVERNHVVLLSARVNAETATWGVTFDNMFYHNFEVLSLTPLSFINMPIKTSYFIKHPKWKN